MSRRLVVGVMALAAVLAVPAGALVAAPAGDVAPPAAQAPRPLVTPCSPVIGGGLGADGRRLSLVVGDTVLYPARTWARYPAAYVREFLARTGDRAAFLFPADVGVGRRAATVTVLAHDRAHAALLFDRGAFRRDGRYPLAAGRAAVRFTACPGRRRTRAVGGVLVDGPRCVSLRIAERGRPPVTRTLRLGSGRPCR